MGFKNKITYIKNMCESKRSKTVISLNGIIKAFDKENAFLA